MKVKIYTWDQDYTATKEEVIETFKDFIPNDELEKYNIYEFVVCHTYKIYWTNIHNMTKYQLLTLLQKSKNIDLDSIQIII